MLGPGEIRTYIPLGSAERKLMEKAFERMGLTARTYHKILRVARTIADLDYSEKVTEKHLKEAIAYRSLDKNIGDVKKGEKQMIYEYWLAGIKEITDLKKQKLREVYGSGKAIYYIEETKLDKLRFLNEKDVAILKNAKRYRT